jgi:hypothetical protein
MYNSRSHSHTDICARANMHTQAQTYTCTHTCSHRAEGVSQPTDAHTHTGSDFTRKTGGKTGVCVCVRVCVRVCLCTKGCACSDCWCMYFFNSVQSRCCVYVQLSLCAYVCVYDSVCMPCQSVYRAYMCGTYTVNVCMYA